MGKRSDFKRNVNDKYDTPANAVWPLLDHLVPGTIYAEPCAGKGQLIRHLTAEGFKCGLATDIAPHNSRSPIPIEKRSALSLTDKMLTRAKVQMILTNPPWTRELLHPMIEHFMTLRPTLLLFDADWMHTGQASELLKRCERIISVGRVKWIPKSKHVGMDNCCWYFFPCDHYTGPTFIGRKPG